MQVKEFLMHQVACSGIELELICRDRLKSIDEGDESGCHG